MWCKILVLINKYWAEKNRSSFRIFIGIIVVLCLQNLVLANGNESLNTFYQITGHYGLVSEGVGLVNVTTGDIILDVPGSVVTAWLYYGGFDRDFGGLVVPAISVDGGESQIPVNVIENVNEPDSCWWWGPFYGYIYRVDITDMVQANSHTYTLSNFRTLGLDGVYQGASIVVIYEDNNLPLQEIEIQDGYDGIWDAYAPPRGPNSSVVTFPFASQPLERDFYFSFILGGVNTDASVFIRTDALWYYFGYEGDSVLPNLVDESGAIDYLNSSSNPPTSFDINPACDADGKEWDNTTINIKVPEDVTFLSFQIESETSVAVGEQKYKAASMLFFGAAKMMVGMGCIGDLVWLDSNENGIKDVDESGLDGVTLYLVSDGGDTLSIAVTGDDPETAEVEQGWYCFKDLQYGSYTVTIDTTTIPSTYELVSGTLPHNVEIELGEDYVDADFGYKAPLFDFGDAEDEPYPSLLNNNGARHGQGSFYLGNGVTYEEESNQPDGDQMDDGVQLLGSSAKSGGYYRLPLLPGEYAALRIRTGGTLEESAYLHGWVDWNQDGDWDDQNEKIFSSIPVTVPGVDTVEFIVPGKVIAGSIWARIRIDDQNLDSPVGEALHGEVEDYFWEDALVAVEFTSFHAITGVGGIILEWATQSETENLGFNIYRADTEGGDYQRINTDLIPGKGTLEQATKYSYMDNSVETEKRYYYKISDVNYQGYETMHGPVTATVVTAPMDYHLEQNYPNPFNPETKITYALKNEGNVELVIYNMVGQKITTLVKTSQKAGVYQVAWDGMDENGNIIPSGVYICKLKSGGIERSIRMTFLR